MLFHTETFILGFLPIILGGFFLLGGLADGRWALGWLVGGSLFFYGWWNPAHVPLLAASIVANHWLGRRIHELSGNGRAAPAKRWLVSGVVLNLGLLGWFKYAGFLQTIIAPAAHPLDIALPLAISFFTFQQIMFLTESWKSEIAGAGTQRAGILPYAAFVAFFPHLIAGPIVRPGEIMPQLQARGLARPDAVNLAHGMEIFLLGLCKKLVLADTFGRFADTGFDAAAQGEALTLFEAWYALLAYSLQIYFDFSGYSGIM